MQYSDNYNMNLPEASDQYNVDDFNENFKILDEKVASKADSEGGDIADTIVTFDDSGETEDVTSFTEFLSSLVSGLSIAKFFRNLKAGLQFVLHVGSIVDNCVTDNSELPLSAAMGKELQDQITELNSEMASREDIVAGSAVVYPDGVAYCDITVGDAISSSNAFVAINGDYLAWAGSVYGIHADGSNIVRVYLSEARSAATRVNYVYKRI